MVPFVAPEALARRVGREQLLRLGANESSFGPSPRALAAMREAVEQANWYGDPESADLREALAAKHHCRAASICVASGIDDLLGLLVRAYVGSGGIALATRGTYPTFGFHVVGFGGRLETVSYTGEGKVDVKALVRSADILRPSLVYMANPDNPSGTFIGKEEVLWLRDRLPPESMLLLDEAYADFAQPHELPDEPWTEGGSHALHPSVVRVRTFSKAYGMAGARIGYAIAGNDTIATLQKIRHHYGVNRTAQAGALAALDDSAFIERVIAENEAGREEYYRIAAGLGLRYLPSRTNFVTIEIGSRSEAEAVVGAMLERGVFIRKPGAPPLDGFVRVSVGTPAERAAFADAFAEALGKDNANVPA